MSAPAYSLEAWRRLCAQKEFPLPTEPKLEGSEPRTIPWREWFATAPLEIDQEALKALGTAGRFRRHLRSELRRHNGVVGAPGPALADVRRVAPAGLPPPRFRFALTRTLEANRGDLVRPRS